MLVTSVTFLALLALSPVSARSHSRRAGIGHKFIVRQNKPERQCKQFFTVPEGTWCHVVAEKFNLTLEEFYALNPQVDDVCSNLFAGEAYCVSADDSPATASKLSIAPEEPEPKSSSEEATTSTSVAAPASAKARVVVPSTTAAPAPAPTPKSTYVAPAPSSTPPAPVVSSERPAQVAAASPAPAPAPAPATDGGNSLLAEAGATAFGGLNTNSIASWFRTNFAGDSTNGNSWCGYPYNDNDPIFAPDVVTMLDTFGGDYVKAGVAYCGLEAIFTTPEGRTATFFIGDGFDRKWVLTPSSVDIAVGVFARLFGRETSDKNDVVQGVTWKFTGNRNPAYKFKGYGH